MARTAALPIHHSRRRACLAATAATTALAVTPGLAPRLGYNALLRPGNGPGGKGALRSGPPAMGPSASPRTGRTAQTPSSHQR